MAESLVLTVAEASEMLGITPRWGYELRHFVATELLAAGTPVNAVSKRLGHGSAAVTLDVYGHAVPAADRGAADLLGGLLGGVDDEG